MQDASESIWMVRANALQVKPSQGADTDAALETTRLQPGCGAPLAGRGQPYSARNCGKARLDQSFPHIRATAHRLLFPIAERTPEPLHGAKAR
jgi:hypothetical protein